MLGENQRSRQKLNMMHSPPVVTTNATDALKLLFFRFASGGIVPSGWFEKRLPGESERHQKTGELSLEIVSHCWQYSHMLQYQLSSLVLYAPKQCKVKMTVLYSEDDANTVALLDYFSAQVVPNVTWNWQPMHKHSLFRRSIGRNMAAKSTSADWIWFTDCDLLFHKSCLDTLCEKLQGMNAALVYPKEERTTPLLENNDSLLTSSENNGKPLFKITDIDTDRFETHQRTRATGPLQITHGDVARAVGYCDALDVFQKPDTRWRKTYEDTAYRWLLQTQGVGVDVPGVYRIRHLEKGRYQGDGIGTSVRKKTREVQSNLRGE